MPSELSAAPSPLWIASPRATWWRPASLDELLALKAAHPQSRVVAGNTELGIEARYKSRQCATLLSPRLVAELYAVAEAEGAVSRATSHLGDISAVPRPNLGRTSAVSRLGGGRSHTRGVREPDRRRGLLPHARPVRAARRHTSTTRPRHVHDTSTTRPAGSLRPPRRGAARLRGRGGTRHRLHAPLVRIDADPQRRVPRRHPRRRVARL